MKNLINRVLVVLTVTALCAGSIDAAQSKRKGAKPVATKMAPQVEVSRLIQAIANLDQLQYARGVYTQENIQNNNASINADIAIIKSETKGEMASIKIIENIIADKKMPLGTPAKAASFRNGNAAKALAVIKASALNSELKEATAELKKDQNPKNLADVAQKQIRAEAAIAELDETAAGYKQYITKRNALYATIGIAGIAVTAYCMHQGVPENVKIFVSPYLNKISQLGESLGFGETGYIGSTARSVGGAAYNMGGSIATSMGLAAAKNRIAQMLGYEADKQKDLIDKVQLEEQQQINAEINAEAAANAAK